MKNPTFLAAVHRWGGQRFWRFLAATAFVLIILRLAIPWDDLFDTRRPRTIILYSFSIMREVITDGIVPLFREHWKERTGESVEFIPTFAGSGLITNLIIRRVQPEIAILASELDALQLREHGILMIPSKDRLPHRGVLSRSPIVIIVRSGNPKSIRTIDRLTNEGINVVIADPRTSGGAQWALIAAYNEFLDTAGGSVRALERLIAFWDNVSERPPDARRAREVFEGGVGDALITYEAEAIRHLKRAGITDEIVYLQTPLMSEHIVMIINRNIQPEQRELVSVFLDFLWSESAQRLLVDYGFRSVDEPLNTNNASFPRIQTARVLDDLGGAARAKEDVLRKVLAEANTPSRGGLDDLALPEDSDD